MGSGPSRVRRTRTLRLASALALLLALGGGGLLWLDLGRDGRGGSSPAPAPDFLDPATAAALAGDACREAEEFLQLAAANAASVEVLRALERAVRTARRALDRDPHWVQLLSGLQTVRYALRHDDAASARDGIRLVRSMCSEAGVELPR